MLTRPLSGSRQTPAARQITIFTARFMPAGAASFPSLQFVNSLEIPTGPSCVENKSIAFTFKWLYLEAFFLTNGISL